MRYSSLLLILLLAASACGKKKRIIRSGNTMEKGEIIQIDEVFIDHDSVFETVTHAPTKVVMEIKRAKNDSDLRCGTFTDETFFPSGKTESFNKFVGNKREGKSRIFFESGKIESETSYENGFMSGYKTWYEDGKIQITGELLSDSTFRHREYSESGLPLKEMITDKTGNGSCSVYHLNGKIRETGPLVDFNPSGVWKIYDTTGILTHDTLFMAEGPLKRK
jgi:antitoxin component YwqK of YwqJK toxin-antitoxin module